MLMEYPSHHVFPPSTYFVEYVFPLTATNHGTGAPQVTRVVSSKIVNGGKSSV